MIQWKEIFPLELFNLIMHKLYLEGYERGGFDVADLNGDGTLDLVCAIYESKNIIFLQE
jgi:hypothetical protein